MTSHKCAFSARHFAPRTLSHYCILSLSLRSSQPLTFLVMPSIITAWWRVLIDMAAALRSTNFRNAQPLLTPCLSLRTKTSLMSPKLPNISRRPCSSTCDERSEPRSGATS